MSEVAPRPEQDPRISKIFYYFQENTDIASGRTVGRKIGVVQEIICRKLLLRSSAVRDCLIYEPKMPGQSGASHKVEFVLFQPLEAAEVAIGSSYSFSALDVEISVIEADTTRNRVRLEVTKKPSGRERVTTRPDSVVSGPSLILAAGDRYLLKLVGVTTRGVRLALLDRSRAVATVESKRVGAQRFSKSQQLGSGIQTIEKAKQAALVAADLDLRYNGTVLPLQKPGKARSYRSFVVLGNGVHWTLHDRAILGTFVDYTYLVRDDAIIRYAEYVRERASNASENFFDFFMAYFQGMTKTPADSFAVRDDDFAVVAPGGNRKTLVARLMEQISAYDVHRA